MSGYSRFMERAFVSGTFPPEHRIVPTISGTPSVPNVLTCTQGTWTNNPTSYAYQWVRGYVPWTNIGTNAATYTLTAAESGNVVRCVVSAVNAAGTTVGPPTDLVKIA